LSAGEGENVWAFSFFLNIKATRVVTKGVDIIITSARVLWILFTARLLFLNAVHPAGRDYLLIHSSCNHSRELPTGGIN
jgi:hypothetical protein